MKFLTLITLALLTEIRGWGCRDCQVDSLTCGAPKEFLAVQQAITASIPIQTEFNAYFNEIDLKKLSNSMDGLSQLCPKCCTPATEDLSNKCKEKAEASEGPDCENMLQTKLGEKMAIMVALIQKKEGVPATSNQALLQLEALVTNALDATPKWVNEGSDQRLSDAKRRKSAQKKTHVKKTK